MLENQKIILRAFIVLFFIMTCVIAGVSVYLAYINSLLLQQLPDRTRENVFNESILNKGAFTETLISKSTISSEITWSLEAVTPTPIVLYELKSNALILWSLYTQEKYNSTGSPTTNAKVMRVFDIPNDVSCLVGSEGYYWLPSRFQRWRVDCRTNDFKGFTAFIINGTAAQGLTGGIYYDILNPILVSGMGDWPEVCYSAITTFPATSVPRDRQEPNETPTPPTSKSPQTEK